MAIKDRLEVSGGMMGSASSDLGAKPLPLADLIKSSIKRSSHPTAVVNFKGRFSSEIQYALYFISDALGLTQHMCLVDVDRDPPYQMAVMMANKETLKAIREACDKSLALIDAMENHKGPWSIGEEMKEKQKKLPKEGWADGTDGEWHYCKYNEYGDRQEAVCDGFSIMGRLGRLLKKPKGKKCPDCVAKLKSLTPEK